MFKECTLEDILKLADGKDDNVFVLQGEKVFMLEEPRTFQYVENRKLKECSVVGVTKQLLPNRNLNMLFIGEYKILGLYPIVKEDYQNLHFIKKDVKKVMYDERDKLLKEFKMFLLLGGYL